MVLSDWAKSFAPTFWEQHQRKELGAYAEGSLAEVYARREVIAYVRPALETCKLLMAYVANDPDQYCGWAAGSTDRVEYVYVKKPFRRRGIGLWLLETLTGGGNQLNYTHRTDKGAKLVARYAANHGRECLPLYRPRQRNG